MFISARARPCCTAALVFWTISTCEKGDSHISITLRSRFLPICNTAWHATHIETRFSGTFSPLSSMWWTFMYFNARCPHEMHVWLSRSNTTFRILSHCAFGGRSGYQSDGLVTPGRNTKFVVVGLFMRAPNAPLQSRRRDSADVGWKRLLCIFSWRSFICHSGKSGMNSLNPKVTEATIA